MLVRHGCAARGADKRNRVGRTRARRRGPWHGAHGRELTAREGNDSLARRGVPARAYGDRPQAARKLALLKLTLMESETLDGAQVQRLKLSESRTTGRSTLPLE